MASFVVWVDLAGRSAADVPVATVLRWLMPDRDGHEVVRVGEFAAARSRFCARTEAGVDECGEFRQGQSEPFVVFDGRLDDRPDLLRALGAARRVCDDPSDTQLVSAAYSVWGESCVNRLSGEFAFVVWHPQTRTLFGASDPMGGRHLRFAQRGSSFVVGSRTAPVAALMPGCWQPNERLLRAHLRSDYSPWVDETCYEGVRRLWAGRAMRVSGGHVTTWTYSTEMPRSRREVDERQVVHQFRTALAASVDNAVEASGPVGVSLSGGIDSSLLAALAAVSPRQPTLVAYASVFRDTPRADELAHQRAVVERYPQLQWRSVVADDAVYFDAGGLCAHVIDEVEYGMPSGMLHDRLRVARLDGSRVMLTGHNADQLLAANYGDWRYLPLLSARRLPEEWPHFWRARPPAWRSSIAALVRGLSHGLRGGTVSQLRSREAILGGWAVWNRGFLTSAGDNAGVELRTPYLSGQLARLVWSAAPELMLRSGYTKYLLRKAAEPLLSGDAVWSGVPAVFGDLVVRGLDRHRSELRKRLDCSPVLEAGWADGPLLRGLLEQHLTTPVRGRLRPLMRWLEVDVFLRSLGKIVG